ncbi:hypothetical protein [Paeniglutamicibacter cryotolerans]|uniref:Uncharacterized protein n=1 Tax=Paeniglutamicibacter cryotolerans TaxID=670079 RepID=A0A839QGN5_9MICC|nr:hypothetical protein [Paeniglutamicibacter cryotolerans]MBB2995508.1 hypothetical protein [Paeniglutamicibacter cryotolerans]
MTTGHTLPHLATPCVSFDPGHGISPERLSTARADAAAWKLAFVSCGTPVEPINIRTTQGSSHYTVHDPLPLIELIRVTGGLPGKVTWNPEAGILGVLNNPRIRAGYRYFSMTASTLNSCTLDHEPELAADFASVIGAFGLPYYERNTGSSA